MAFYFHKGVVSEWQARPSCVHGDSEHGLDVSLFRWATVHKNASNVIKSRFSEWMLPIIALEVKNSFKLLEIDRWTKFSKNREWNPQQAVQRLWYFSIRTNAIEYIFCWYHHHHKTWFFMSHHQGAKWLFFQIWPSDTSFRQAMDPWITPKICREVFWAIVILVQSVMKDQSQDITRFKHAFSFPNTIKPQLSRSLLKTVEAMTGTFLSQMSFKWSSSFVWNVPTLLDELKLGGVNRHYIVHQTNISGFTKCFTEVLIW